MPRRDYRAELRARNARARAAGFASYYAQRVARGRREGLTRSQAAGHPKIGEVPARTLRTIRSDLTTAARSYIIEAPVRVRSAKTGRKLKRTEMQTIMVTIDERGKMRTRVLDRAEMRSVKESIERQNRVRRRRGLPDIPPPEESPGADALRRWVEIRKRARTYRVTLYEGPEIGDVASARIIRRAYRPNRAAADRLADRWREEHDAE